MENNIEMIKNQIKELTKNKVTITYNTWDDFIEFTNKLRQILDLYEESIPLINGKTKIVNSNSGYLPKLSLLYRGQQEANWKLDTTLERKTRGFLNKPLKEYLNLVLDFKDELKTYITTSFHAYIPLITKIDKLNKEDFAIIYKDIFKYLVFLRHYGFPSPLLDWTRSPYIASYFAFNKIESNDKETNVAIYIYINSLVNCKGGWVGHPKINHFPHKNYLAPIRHYNQQAEYTICTKEDVSKEELLFYSYNDFIQNSSIDNEQDIILKICIPKSEKIKVFKQLEQMNINAYTLFGNTESFLEYIANRDLIKICN